MTPQIEQARKCIKDIATSLELSDEGVESLRLALRVLGRCNEEFIASKLEEASTFTHTPPNYLQPIMLCFLPTKEIRDVVATAILHSLIASEEL